MFEVVCVLMGELWDLDEIMCVGLTDGQYNSFDELIPAKARIRPKVQRYKAVTSLHGMLRKCEKHP